MGRWVPGVTGCPGGRSPNRVTYAKLRDSGLSCITPEHIKAVYAKMIEQAIAGDKDARRDLLAIIAANDGKLKEMAEMVEAIEDALGIPRREGVVVRGDMEVIEQAGNPPVAEQ